MSQLLTDYCKDLTLTSNRPVTFNESSHLSMEIWSMPSHRFELEYLSIPIKGTQAQRALFSYLDSLKQGANTFTWVLPIHSEPNGTADENPLLSASASAGDLSVFVSRGDDGNDFLLPGDMIKFSNHNKVYMVENVVTGLNPSVTLNAPLKKAVTTSDTMITRNVDMTLRADPNFDAQSYSRTGGDLYTTFQAKFIEVV